MLGFSPEQIAPGLLAPSIGNTYSGAAIIGLTAILDIAKAGDLILMTSYGSGAGSDSFILRVNEALEKRRGNALTTQDYISRRTEIDYATYLRFRGEIVVR
jgi:hydroxymethylglutaryl-CoA synthase